MRNVGAVLWLFTLVMGTACEAEPSSPTTKTVVIVDADSSVMKTAAKLYVRVDSDGVELLARELDHDLWMQQFVVEPPKGDASRSFELVAEAYDRYRERVASGRLKTGFVAGQTRYARITLTACTKAEGVELEPSDLVRSASLASAVTAQCPEDAGSGQAGSGGASGRALVPNIVEAGVGGGSGAGQGAGGGGAPAPNSCGDGALGDEELCDPKIAADKLGACPKSCSSQDTCKRGQLVGAGCQAHCEYTTIKEPVRDDGCCPERATANTDNDCKAKCGNGVPESGETCDPPASCTVAVLCSTAAACTVPMLKGNTDQCSATCDIQPLTICKSGDRCCPAGCINAQDDDCPVKCGDGVVDTEAGETCEPSSSTQACKQSCGDNEACTDDIMLGSPMTCNVSCSNPLHLSPRDSDGCCPVAANANNDNDCAPKCGNGVPESGERCDGDCPSSAEACNDGMACTIDSVMGTGCQRRCSYTERAAASTPDDCCPEGATDSSDPDCKNLLTGKIFESSLPDSTAEPGHPVRLVTDDNDNTRWISRPASPVTLTVDLGAAHTLKRIAIIWAGDTIKRFNLEISADNAKWTTIVSGMTGNVQMERESYEMFSADPTGRYFRITGRDRWVSSYGNSIFEVRLYGQ